MAGLSRRNSSIFNFLHTFFFSFPLALLLLPVSVSAIPSPHPSLLRPFNPHHPLPPIPLPPHLITPPVIRRSYIINNSTGTPEVFNPSTQQFIPQGPATDGSGTDFDISAIIWLAFVFVVGIPMAFFGIRLWRITTGVGIGLACAVCSWAALINTLNSTGLPDAVLTAIVLSFFVVGFVFGLFDIGHVAGITLIGILGGLSFGVRVVLLRPGLLVNGTEKGEYGINWVVVALFGVLGGAGIVGARTRRGGIVFGCASIGTFFIGLGVDLILHHQAGLSRGLRFLFDRNGSHIVDILEIGYTPTLVTQIILAVSLGLTPILAYGQHGIFKQPFSRKRRDSSLEPLPDLVDEKLGPPHGGPHGHQEGEKRQTFLFNLWNGAQSLGSSAKSRFSL